MQVFSYEFFKIFKDEDTLWNISFRLHQTQFNAYFTTFNLTSRNSYKICKKETSANIHKKKMPYPHICHISMLWTFVFLMKRLFSQETVFFSQIILPEIKKKKKREIKTGSFTIEFMWSRAINNFRPATLYRIFKYSTEHLKVPGNL